MFKKTKKISVFFMVVMLLTSSMSVSAASVNFSYSLRQLSGVPVSSNVYSTRYVFQALSSLTVATCTQATTSGANVRVLTTNGMAAYLDQVNASASVYAILGDIVIADVSLKVPDSYNTYTGYGTING